MNIKAKSHLKHLNIKIYLKKKLKKLLITRNTLKYLQVRFSDVSCTGWGTGTEYFGCSDQNGTELTTLH